jgi:ferredoxin-fold anticodon binding domain-containing protein
VEETAMDLQRVENLFRRYKGQTINIKTLSGGVYEGTVSDVTSDYVALMIKIEGEDEYQVFVLFHSIESVLPKGRT